MTDRIIIKTNPLVTVNPVLVEKARQAIRWRRDNEVEVSLSEGEPSGPRCRRFAVEPISVVSPLRASIAFAGEAA